jgi:hypothetical protein
MMDAGLARIGLCPGAHDEHSGARRSVMTSKVACFGWADRAAEKNHKNELTARGIVVKTLYKSQPGKSSS